MKRKIQFVLLYISVAAIFWFVGYEQRFRVVETNAQYVVVHGSNLHVVIYDHSESMQGLMIVGWGNDIQNVACPAKKEPTPAPKPARPPNKIITLAVFR